VPKANGTDKVRGNLNVVMKLNPTFPQQTAAYQSEQPAQQPKSSAILNLTQNKDK
jgi:hypothetical protein